MNNTAYDKYLQKVECAISGASPPKKEILLHMKYAVIDFATEHPDFKYDDLIAEFGNPDSITDTILSLETPQVIQKKLQHKRTAILVTIILLLAFAGFLITATFHHNNAAASSGHITIEDIETINE